MVNFILDDEFPHSSIPPEALRVLRHPMSASHAPGMIVTLIVQGLRTKFVVGVEGEAGRLNADWMKKGGLAVDLDDSLDAPVLYGKLHLFLHSRKLVRTTTHLYRSVADGDQSNPRTNLPRTIKQWFRNNVKDLPLNRGSSSADTGQVPTRREHGYAPWIYSEFETRSNPNSRSLWGHHNPQFPGNENPSSSLYSSQPPPRSADRPITSFDSRPPPRYSFSQGHMSLFPPSSSGHRTTTFDTYLHPSAVVSPEGGGALLHDDLLHPPSSAPSRLSFDTDHSPAPPPYADH